MLLMIVPKSLEFSERNFVLSHLVMTNCHTTIDVDLFDCCGPLIAYSCNLVLFLVLVFLVMV